MQDLEISMKARTEAIIDFGYKMLYGGFEDKPLNFGRECGEALDPVFKRNLHHRLVESSVVLAKDRSSSISGQCQPRESVKIRAHTQLATILNPSSLPVLPQISLDLRQNMDSSIPISPRPNSCSSSGYCSDESSIQDEVFTDTDVVDHETIQGYKDKLDNIEKLLEDSNSEIRRLNAANDSLQAKELDLLERQVVAQEAMLTLSMNKTQKEADAKRHDALVEGKAKANSILFDVEELSKVVNGTNDWKNASDIEVKKGMRNVDKWKGEMKKIIETKREFMILVEKNNFRDDDVKKDRVEREVNDLKSKMDAVIQSVESEDITRALYSLDTTPVRDPVKLPKFSGKDDEDFHAFKEEMKRGFVENRIPRANQLSKLRECLSGAALAFVPKYAVMTIDEAWAVLKKSYGDAYRIIKYRKAELMKVGKFPKVNTKDRGGYNQQIFWFLKVENLLKSVLDLGKRHPEYSDVAFSFEFISNVIMMFPERLRTKLCECPGKKGDHLQNIVLKIENLREVAQCLQLVVEASTPYLAVASDDGPVPGTQQRSQGSGGGGQNVVRGPVAYKHPRRDKKRRNCNMLETEKSKSKPSFKEIEDIGTVMKVENQNKIDRKLDDESQVVEKVNDDIPEVSEKEIDSIPEERVSFNDSYALEAAGNDENDLLEDLEATTADASTSDDLPKLESNASFVNEVQVKHHLENSKDTNGTCVDATKDISEDNDEGVDVKGKISNISDRESNTKDDRETEQQLNHELAPKVLDESKNLIAEAEDKFKAKLTNEFTEDGTDAKKVKVMFVGTFLDNYEDILENLDKIVDENGRKDANQLELANGNEIKEKDSKSEGSRYEMRPVYNEETFADVKHEPFASEVFQDFTMLSVCIIKIILTSC